MTITSKLSTDANNDLAIGTDGGLFVGVDNLLTGATWDDTTNNLVLAFETGADVNVPIIDNVGTFLMDITISDGTATDVVNNHETLVFS